MSIDESVEKARVVAAWTAVGAALIAAAGLLVYRYQVRSLRAQEYAELAFIAQVKADALAVWIEERLDDARLFASGAIGRGFAASAEGGGDPAGRGAPLALMRDVRSAYGLREVILVRPDGRVLLSAGSSVAVLDAEEVRLAAAVAAAGRPGLGQFFVSAACPRACVDAAAPIRGSARRVVGVILMRIGADEHLYPLFTRWPVPSRSGEGFLVRRVGDEVVFLSPLRFRRDPPLGYRVPLARTDRAVARVLGGDESVSSGADYRGVRVMAAAHGVPGTDWAVVAEVDEAEALAQADFLAVVVTAAGVLSVAILAVLLLYARARGERRRLAASAARDAELARANRVARLASAASGIGVWTWDVAGGRFEWSPEMFAVFGLDPAVDRAGFAAWEAVLHPGDRADARRRLDACIRDGTRLVDDCRIVRPDGAVRWILALGEMEYDDAGRPVRMSGTCQDITERKLIEERVRRTAERLMVLSEFARVGGWEFEVPSLNLFWDDEVRRIHEVETDYAPTLEKAIAFYTPESTPVLRTALKAAIEEGKSYELVLSIVTAKGRRRRVSARGMPEVRDGKVVKVWGTFQDVTERVEAAEKLSSSERKLSEAERLGHTGSWEYDATTATATFSANMYRIIDVAPGTPRAGDLDWFLRTAIHPDDRARTLGVLRAALDGERRFEAEFRVIRKDGGVRDIHASADAVRDANGKVVRLLGKVADVTEKRSVAAEQARLRQAIEQAGETVVITDDQARIVYVNPAFEAVTGYTRREAIGQNPRILKSGRQDAAFYRTLWDTITSGGVWKGRLVNKRKDGTLFTEFATISPVRDSRGRISNYIAVKRDITEQLKLEESLLQARKMESVGRLAGGVAHDFNNLLTAIIGFASILLGGLSEEDSRREDVKGIIAASEKAAALTRQLLAFSRKQVRAPRVHDLRSIVDNVTTMLARVIGEDVRLVTRPDARPCPVLVDAGQVEQVLMNLAANARDAMSSGGTLTLSVEPVARGPEISGRFPDLKADDLVRLTVADTGRGMSAQALAHAFEPFFTTKEVGKGTGLGLATVHGIVKQNGGEIEVESVPDRGTTFRVYLPRAAAGAAPGPEEAAAAGDSPRGAESVLLVEDDETIRRFAARALAGNGYSVVSAADGAEALGKAVARGTPFDLLLTDVVMPGMSGRELARELAARRLAGRTLFVSGYPYEAVARHGVLEPGLAFLYKPFSPVELLRKVRAVLDGAAADSCA